MKTIKEIFGTVMAFISSTGFVYVGCIVYALFIWFIAPKSLGWVGWYYWACSYRRTWTLYALGH